MPGPPPKARFTDQERELAISLFEAGKPVQEVAEQLLMSLPMFNARRRNEYEHPELKERWERAKVEGIESLADSLISVDEKKGPYQARIYSENIKWLLARRAAPIYGDRLDLTQGVTTVDISKALSDARARAVTVAQAPALHIQNALENAAAIDAELVDVEGDELAKLLE